MRSPLGHSLVITQDFGVHEGIFGLKNHTGVDFRSPLGDNWFTCVPGVLHLGGTAPYLTGYGAYWKLDWNQGDGSVITFIYGHAKNRQKGLDNHNVKEGVKIAQSGNTGWSTGPHLHFEMRLYKTGRRGYTLLNPRTQFLDKYKIAYSYKK